VFNVFYPPRRQRTPRVRPDCNLREWRGAASARCNQAVCNQRRLARRSDTEWPRSFSSGSSGFGRTTATPLSHEPGENFTDNATSRLLNGSIDKKLQDLLQRLNRRREETKRFQNTLAKGIKRMDQQLARLKARESNARVGVDLRTWGNAASSFRWLSRFLALGCFTQFTRRVLLLFLCRVCRLRKLDQASGSDVRARAGTSGL